MSTILIRDACILTCDAQRRVIHGNVLVQQGLVQAVGPGVQAPAHEPTQIIDAAGDAVLPGLIQLHVHLCQTLMRGMAEDLPLLQWLTERVWPLEAAHDEPSLRTSAELGLAELLLSGTTTVLDMGTTHAHDVVFDACARAGIRAFSGKAMMDRGSGVPRRLRESTRESLRESDALRDRWQGTHQGRLRYAYAPRFILSCSEALLRQTAERAAAADDVFIHTHASEHPDEKKAVYASRGAHDVELLARYGVRGQRTVLAHCVQLSKRQIAMVARHQTRVAHCPSANLKLGSGIAPVRSMLDAGIAVGIGTDGAACNNSLDAWGEMRMAALVAKLRDGPAAFSAQDALDLGTVHAAQALGLQAQIGSIEAGKKADLVVAPMSSLEHQPVISPVDALILGSRSGPMRYVMVDGIILVREGQLQVFDAEALRHRASEQAAALARRAGLS